QCMLSGPTIDAVLRSDLNVFEAQLTHSFPEYQSYPAHIQEGLMDMVFNLGIGTLNNSFPDFCTLVKAKLWAKAAEKCHRLKINEERNKFVKDLFLFAVPPLP